MSFSAARLTCYALLSAIEEDLRDLLVIAARDQQPSQVLHSVAHANAQSRYAREEGAISAASSLPRLLPYVDFPDLIAAINRYRLKLDEHQSNALLHWSENLEKLMPIRNRVAHSRPLDFGDLAYVLDTADLFVQERSIPWPSLVATRNRLKRDPSYVLNLEIKFANVEHSSQRHNLPLPDFDDTGLLGRRSAEQNLQAMLRGAYPVISIVGDGGVGKTALALKAAYGVLDDPARPFDAVVWTTAKARQLTNTEVVRIEGAIQDSLGMLSAAATNLGGEAARGNAMNEVLEYMRTFKILLVLDNLETVLDQRLRGFLTQLPTGSKVLITSRIGLGALENPLKLGPLENQHALALLRESAKVRGVQSLARLPNDVLGRFVKRMKAHPLYIKWFVSAVQAGRRPEEVLRDSSEILDYCMSNVYEYLGVDSRQVLKSLQALPGTHSQSELSYLNDMDADAVQPAVAELITTNFVHWQSVPVGGGVSTEYQVTEFAQTYLDRRHPLGEHQRRELLRRRDELLSQGKRLADAHAADPYAAATLEIRGPGDFSVASRLVNAISLKEREDIGTALQLVQEAQTLAPDYHECYRVEALIHDSLGDVGRARQCLEAAYEHAEKSVPLLHFFGTFLMRRAGEPDRGLKLLQQAAKLRPDDTFLHLEVASGHVQIGDYRSAIDVAMHVLGAEGARADLRKRAVRIALKASALLVERYIESSNIPAAVEAVDELSLQIPALSRDLDTIGKRRLMQCIDLAERCARLAADPYLVKRSALRASEFRELVPDGPNVLQYARVGRIKKESMFGFLIVPGRDLDLFFHKSAVRPHGAFTTLESGDEVCFRLGVDKQGREKAVEVVIFDE